MPTTRLEPKGWKIKVSQKHSFRQFWYSCLCLVHFSSYKNNVDRLADSTCILKYNIQHRLMISSSPVNIFCELNHLHRPQISPCLWEPKACSQSVNQCNNFHIFAKIISSFLALNVHLVWKNPKVCSFTCSNQKSIPKSLWGQLFIQNNSA